MATDLESTSRQVALLDALAAADGFLDTLPDLASLGVPRDAVLDTASHLITLGWISSPVQFRGDGRLSAVRQLRLTASGRENLPMLRARLRVQSHGTQPAASPDHAARRRTRFMSALYDATHGGRSLESADPIELGAAEGWNDAATDAVVEYLVNEGLVEFVTFGQAGLTHEGRKEVERARSAPSQPTEHLAALNLSLVTVHGNMTDSQIQSASPGASLNVGYGAEDLDAIRSFLTRLREALPSLIPDSEEQASQRAVIDAADALVAAPKPDRRLLGPVMATLKELALGVSGNAAYAGLFEAATRLT